MKSPSENGLITVEQCELINNNFWNIKDLSKYLKVKIKTLYSMIYDIPHYRIGRLIRFKKEEIDSWLKSKKANVHHQTIHNKKPQESINNQIDLLVRKTIDRVKQEDYTSCHGKSDRIKTQEKEMNYGSI